MAFLLDLSLRSRIFICSLRFDKKKRAILIFVKSQFAPFCSGCGSYWKGKNTKSAFCCFLDTKVYTLPLHINLALNCMIETFRSQKNMVPIGQLAPSSSGRCGNIKKSFLAAQIQIGIYVVICNYIKRALNCIRNFPHPEKHRPNGPIGTMRFRLRQVLKRQEHNKIFWWYFSFAITSILYERASFHKVRK